MDFEKWREWRELDKATKRARSLHSSLVMANAGLVAKVAREYSRVACKDDLTQAGYMGVMRALERFSPEDRPEAVRTLATLWYVFCRHHIRYAVQEAARAEQTVRRPRGDALEFVGPSELDDSHLGDVGTLLEAPDLSRALATATAAERAAVLGVVVEGYSLAELAARDGYSEDAVSEHLISGWGKIRAAMHGADRVATGTPAPAADETEDDGGPADDDA